MFAFGSVLSWLLQDGDKFQPNLGWALMVVALVAWALRQYAIDSDRRELAVLRRVEQNYLLHWLSSGISDAKFWALRDAFGTRLSIERNSVDTDDWRAQGAAIGQKEAELWHDVRLDALSAAVGELIWLDTAKPIDLRGPTV
ncbi:MAG: hypothetical protein A3E25_13645 [Burkholderiales bacterium RIFCSPHIGHO2_12_FULL_69_20]|nr:MAG: hypothetical protein A3E25_13645 [Burkholderiales bacterium RIFCSPHIGHO2_12_FULL_69_20]